MFLDSLQAIPAVPCFSAFWIGDRISSSFLFRIRAFHQIRLGRGEFLAFRAYCCTYIASTLFLTVFIKGFFRDTEQKPAASFFKPPFSFATLVGICGALAACACMVVPVCHQLRTATGMLAILDPLGDAIVSVQLALVVYSLFVLENTYRFAQEYQRKIARLCFLALFILLVFQLYFQPFAFVQSPRPGHGVYRGCGVRPHLSCFACRPASLPARRERISIRAMRFFPPCRCFFPARLSSASD